MPASFLYNSTTIINESRSRETIWRRLSQFQDIERSTDRLMSRRPEIPSTQRGNVKKQIQEIAFSITQAKEFFRSAEICGPSTRALQAYYGLTALANVLILWDGTGNDSFARRDGRFNSHGLELKIGEDVLEFGAEAKRHRDGSLNGLFGLWHGYATHIPHYAERHFQFGSESGTSRHEPVSSVTALSELPFPSTPLTLLEAMLHLPDLQQSLQSFGKNPKLVRGRMESLTTFDDTNANTDAHLIYTLHPSPTAIRMAVMDKFLFKPLMYEDITIQAPPNGALITINTMREMQGWHSPESFSGSIKQMYFVGDGDYLNEFGFYYVCLYIAGMVARYHPNKWIKEINSNTISASLIDELVDSSIKRVPLLLLSALERSVFIYD
ncbi:hypothetical protein FHW77_001955 [Agrobacterium sp. RC10-4-1]|uniref:YaaC family protein n=1 Tax=Agrobacterium sp. RC10-4-1 TaxID=2587039 RepID=UPI0015FDB3D0|nr:hypothetical protein [Agrobacterium sp. RC10-4-1]MBA8798249.1 hypothetical protein [Agrobacterium sp. RC10-4-1]